MSARRFTVVNQAKALHAMSGLGVVVGAVEDDGEGGAYVAVNFGGLDLQTGEALAAELVSELLRHQLAQDHPCPDCSAREARLREALAALTRDMPADAAQPEAVH